jgi:hypothetical protein
MTTEAQGAYYELSFYTLAHPDPRAGAGIVAGGPATARVMKCCSASLRNCRTPYPIGTATVICLTHVAAPLC